jgi:hypothetical protein
VADIFSSGEAKRRPEIVSETIEVVVLTDVDPPYNIGIVVRGRKEPVLAQRLTLLMRADGPSVGVAEVVTLRQKGPVGPVNPVGIFPEDIAGVCVFKAMTSEEFKRRHGCRSTTG